MSNPVAWFEVVGQDGAKLRRFYGDLFDWKIGASDTTRRTRLAAPVRITAPKLAGGA